VKFSKIIANDKIMRMILFLKWRKVFQKENLID